MDAAVPTNHRPLQVVVDKSYAPYSFESADGTLRGILIDQWKAWEKVTGIAVEFHALEWADAVHEMEAGHFDAIACIVATPDRSAYLDFSPPFATMDVPMFFRKDISGITDLPSLRGFAVGMKAGDQHIDIFKANGITTIIPFPNHAAIVAAAKARQINVFAFDRPSALYHLNKAGIADAFRQSAPLFHDDLRRAVHKGDAATLRLITDGFAAVGPAELKRIEEKWYGRTIDRYASLLSTAAYVGCAAILIIGTLMIWNRLLRNQVEERTVALRESEAQLRQLVGQLHQAREDEARRIARELHDDLGQRLTALDLDVVGLELALADPTAGQQTAISRMHAAIEKTIRVVQAIASELRLGQLDMLGLTAAIEAQVREFSLQTGIRHQILRIDEAEGLSAQQHTAVFRILQEALTNIVRHAHASQVDVGLRCDATHVVLTVEDNGRGITPAQLADRTAIGLRGMRERAEAVGGAVLVTGTDGAGTRVQVTVPRLAPAAPLL